MTPEHPPSLLTLRELFPDEDYRFHLTLRRGDPRTFFAPRDPTGAVLRERAEWIKTGGPRYAALLPEGCPLLAEFGNLLTGSDAISPQSPVATDPRILGSTLEPDFLLLSGDSRSVQDTDPTTLSDTCRAGVLSQTPSVVEGHQPSPLILRGGALCFPTGWALEDKIGHPLDFIHKIVPTLNQTLGRPIDQFFSRLKDGNSFLRANWGIAATPDLNMHPILARPAPKLPLDLTTLWLRVEHQIFTPLPSGIVFGIRIALHRLDTLTDPEVRRGLSRALTTMSPEVAAYKRLDTIRAPLASIL